MLSEVALLQSVYKEIDKGKVIPGFVQHFSCNPFKVILFTENQLRLYLSAEEKVLCLDATGSIIKKLANMDKPIYYYALVMKSPLQGRGAVPLAEQKPKRLKESQRNGGIAGENALGQNTSKRKAPNFNDVCG